MLHRVRNKKESKRLFGLGFFGNSVRQWDSIQEAEESGYKGLLVLRSLQTGGRVIYHLTMAEAKKIEFVPGLNYFNEQLNGPDKRVTFQGEVCRSHRGLELRYSTENLPMRDAMEDARHACGLQALLLMQHFCCPPGYTKIMDLLDEYDGHVVEFTVFDVPCGELKRNTIIWEVRDY
jgi:hypothetical protein